MFPNFEALVWAPEILALLGFVYLSSSEKLSPSFKIAHIFIILLFGFHLMGQIVSSQGIGGSAILSVVLMSVLFFIFLKTAPVNWLNKKIISQVSTIYVIHVCFILFEILLLNTDNAKILWELSNGHYKAANIGSYTPVPQSLFKNSQAASQICVFAASWFVLLYLSRKKLGIRFSRSYAVVLSASLAVFAVYPTTTIQIVGIIMLFAIVYLKPFSGSLFLRFLVPIAGLIFFDPVYKAITYKMDTDLYGRALHYQNAFTNSIDIFFKLPVFNQLWGAGSIESVTMHGAKSGELGIVVIILQIGVVLGSIAIIAFLALLLKMLRFDYSRQFDNPHCFPWLWLGSANALLAVGNLLSLIHYTVAIQTGGRALFSFHIAIVMLSLQHLVHYRRALKMTSVNDKKSGLFYRHN